MLEFAYPWFFFLLPLPLLLVRILPAYREHRQTIQVPFFRRLTTITGEEPRAGAVLLQRMLIQKFLLSLFWLGLICALARPELVGDPIVHYKSARDLMIAVDISKSMDEEDFTLEDGTIISRLNAVKQVLSKFSQKLRHDRLGLILFGSAPYLQVPFTQDHQAFLTLLHESSVGMAGSKTRIGDAIGLAIFRFRQSDTQNKVLIVLSDGNDFGSRVPPIEAAKIASKDNIKIYVIGIGDPETVGEQALDTESMEKVANITGGEYFLAHDTKNLEQIYDKIYELEPEKYDTVSYRPRKNIHYLFLGTVFCIFLGFHTIMSLITFIRHRTRS
ncbi:VWA domain-containing protein [bacterium]|nr:VWA domain-containing protein [bacterium]